MPGCAIASVEFQPAAAAQAKALGLVPAIVWVPHPIRWGNYARSLAYVPFWLYTWNTLKICLLTVIGSVLSGSLVAYSLAKVRWRGRDLVFYSLLATMILPGQVTMIPTFTIFKWLHWIGTSPGSAPATGRGGPPSTG